MAEQKNGEPLLSVVTVVLNGADCIESTIRSVLDQTCRPKEYIVLDGGSIDGTASVIEKYSRRISYFSSEPDRGIYDAMNKGLRLARGRWINFMNAGDTFQDERVAEEVLSAVPEEIDIVYGDTEFLYPDGYVRVFRGTTPEKIWKGLVCYHQSAFVRTRVMKEAMFSLECKIAADYELFFRLFKEGRKFHYSGRVISRMSTGGISYRKRTEAFLEMMHTAMSYDKRRIVKWHYLKRICTAWVFSVVKSLLSDRLVLLIIRMKDTLGPRSPS